MGYTTFFRMSTIPVNMWESEEVGKALKKVVTTKYGKNICMGDYFEGLSYDFDEEMKWYEHDEEMKILSKLCPDIIFILEGNGEDYGDWWKCAYFRGDTRCVIASIPDVDILDWESVL